MPNHSEIRYAHTFLTTSENTTELNMMGANLLQKPAIALLVIPPRSRMPSDVPFWYALRYPHLSQFLFTNSSQYLTVMSYTCNLDIPSVGF